VQPQVTIFGPNFKNAPHLSAGLACAAVFEEVPSASDTGSGVPPIARLLFERVRKLEEPGSALRVSLNVFLSQVAAGVRVA
jgi:hypothetical protein